jgi:hypothetical protein
MRINLGATRNAGNLRRNIRPLYDKQQLTMP